MSQRAAHWAGSGPIRLCSGSVCRKTLIADLVNLRRHDRSGSRLPDDFVSVDVCNERIRRDGLVTVAPLDFAHWLLYHVPVYRVPVDLPKRPQTTRHHRHFLPISLACRRDSTSQAGIAIRSRAAHHESGGTAPILELAQKDERFREQCFVRNRACRVPVSAH